MSPTDHLLYGLLWLSFGMLHSVLASERAKRVTRALFGRRERLAYNLIAALHVALVGMIGWGELGGRTVPAFGLPAAFQGLLWLCLASGLVILLGAWRHYDSGRFTGLTAVSRDDAPEPLHTGGLHRYVRHPLYSGAFLLLIGQANDAFGLATLVWAGLYLVIGTWFEERRLVALYGEAYRDYRRRVPAFLPWRGRAI